MAVVDACALPATAAASGHDIRRHLLEQGEEKRRIVETLGELVEQGIIERIRVNEPSGLFYTAYRRTGTGSAHAK